MNRALFQLAFLIGISLIQSCEIQFFVNEIGKNEKFEQNSTFNLRKVTNQKQFTLISNRTYEFICVSNTEQVEISRITLFQKASNQSIQTTTVLNSSLKKYEFNLNVWFSRFYVSDLSISHIECEIYSPKQCFKEFKIQVLPQELLLRNSGNIQYGVFIWLFVFAIITSLAVFISRNIELSLLCVRKDKQQENNHFNQRHSTVRSSKRSPFPRIIHSKTRGSIGKKKNVYQQKFQQQQPQKIEVLQSTF
jgi:hypothetical protein